MVKIKCLTGPHAGEVRTPSQDTEPLRLLGLMVDQGLHWEIDFSNACREEIIAWGGADLMARAIRAVQEGRGAFFMGVEYSTMESLQTFEDELVCSGYNIQVASDDERGLVVYTVDPE